jgi:hypothetical protein
MSVVADMEKWFAEGQYTACPNCQQVNERAGYLVRGPDTGRTAHYMLAVANMEKWFAEGHTDPDLAHYTIAYLCVRGKETFSSFDLSAALGWSPR